MKNGASNAVLVRDLFKGDGPYLDLAEDFVAQSCTLCGLTVDDDAQFGSTGLLCAPCFKLEIIS
ncbi:MAG: hypothetical protein KJN71_10315 [Acidimicrobiia bacterium]|nr:hypothetical protein [Acidimicrobiia bacterium]NNC75241.1 hypothetical protein [Acidimicrobiia bacterium]